MKSRIQTLPRLRTRILPVQKLDPRALEADLRADIEGEVRFHPGDRALYATDASNYRQVPIGVVVPRHVEDVIRIVQIARRHGAPLLPRGAGTSLAGQCCNVALVIDFSKYMNAVREIDPVRRRARVEPGAILDDLRRATARFGLTFGPDPSTHSRCTFGGMLGNNSCGPHSMLAEFYGPGPRTSDSVEEMEVLTYDGLRLRVGPTPEDVLDRILAQGGRRGEIYARLRSLRDRYADLIRERFPKLARSVSGYNLESLLPENGFNVARALCGSEGTCVTILEATVTLVPDPPARAMLVLGYPSVYDAGDHVPEIREFRPIALEGLDDILVRALEKKGLRPGDVSLLPEGNGWLLAEFGGETREEAAERARAAMAALGKRPNPPAMRLYDDPAAQRSLWAMRESGLGATAFVPGEPVTWEGWEDAAVPVHHLGDYLRDFRRLLDRYGYRCSLYGHFGQGCVHTRIDFDLETAAGIEKYRAFTREAAELVTGKYAGALSGEHGDGQSRGDLLPIMFGEELMQAFREFKAIWDPEGQMNPGKLINALPRDENLRLGADYRPATPATHFRFPDDQGSFTRATLRCVGVGECRKLEGGTMCPSYMVLREEKHTTRGRAHLLFEMLQGEVITEGWKSEAVKESLDLCLACKGCKAECPVNVDVATYKAEFLSHYYEGRLRPRSAYAFGLIHRWARLAAHAPGLANFFTQTPGLRGVARWLSGTAPERRFPRFAPRTFTSWYRRRGPRVDAGAPRVILWADTFNNHFHPETLAAALDVLENAGFRVAVPDARLCCGRPLYDWGMLDQAKLLLRQTLDALRPEIEAGTPIVGLEPSCVAVFRDELTGLFPDDEDALRLRQQALTFDEFLTCHAPNYPLPRLQRKALVHGHCHQKAIMRLDSERQVLERLGIDFQILDSGCCGMAGSFGFEKEKYDLSIRCGERVLLPAVRNAEPDTLIITDGFSCREQIAQATHRRALHLAEVVQLALHGETADRASPERQLARLAPRSLVEPALSPLAAAAGIGAGILIGGAIAWKVSTRR
jgi:FAD/FMN-containing dehydrogenase/Fe-S oxidoreductase